MSVREREFRPHLWMPVPWTGCYVWIGAIGGRDGRARVNFKRKNWHAARAAYVFHFGEIPAGMHVCHRCDNPLCVNPAHLFLGTHNDNMRDMARKARRRRLRLTDEQVRAVRRMYALGATQEAIGREIGTSQSVVSKIVRKRMWANVD